MPDAAIIRKLVIERFRGIRSMIWRPSPGLNIILGGGDVGKSTILDAVGLLLNPSNNVVLSEHDYWDRDIESGFSIQAVVSLPTSAGISQQRKLAWPWEWDGENAIPPVVPEGGDDDIPAPGEPVYCIECRGTDELEASWSVVQPDDSFDPLSTGVRRSIGVVRLAGDERTDRDLRLVYGSALDRLIADTGFRGRVGSQVAGIPLHDNLDEGAETRLQELDDKFKKESLPHNLGLALTTSQGLSIGALVGLHADNPNGVPLPISRWGAGTRRMATLEVAAATESNSRITLVDEVERGLEPYRVRKLVKSLQVQDSQSFVTTHSGIAISAGDGAQLWYLGMDGWIGPLQRHQIARQQSRDPETFLCRIAVIAEGPTEIGFTRYILELGVDGDLEDHGVRVCNGEGNETTLNLLEGLAAANLRFAAFADDEGRFSGRWSDIKQKMGNLVFQWPSGSTEEHVLRAIAPDRLQETLTHVSADAKAERVRTLATRVGTDDKTVQGILTEAENQGITLLNLIIAASTGNTDGAPDSQEARIWKKHGRHWFKSEAGGRELAHAMFDMGAWPSLKGDLIQFVNAVRSALGQDAIDDLV